MLYMMSRPLTLLHACLQMLSSCVDVRQCFYLSTFLLEHMMTHQQDRYWSGLRQLVIQAQHVNDERLLGNPFLQIGTLLRQQAASHGTHTASARQSMDML